MNSLESRPAVRMYFLIWLLAGLIAAFFALQLDSASFVDGHYIPVGNDSFYHARRILDAAIGERGFYQFDNMIHTPEGSWLPWPWAYDYLAAQALSLALLFRPSMDPMAFLVRIPVVWVFVNTALLTLICRQIRLGTPATAVVLLAFAILPLTQNLHGIGFIDHHFLEQTFVFASLLAGLRFFDVAATPARALTLGIVLGMAPAFHNGLFILQLPVLACVFILWLRGSSPPPGQLKRFAIALLVTTLLIVMPSGPFWDMQFEFYTLSWFHLYIAFCSACCVAFAAWRPFTIKQLVMLLGMSAALAIPLLAKVASGADFVSGNLFLLDQISEVRSPLADILTADGVAWASAHYSWLFFLSPLLAVLFAYRIFRGTAAPMLYFSLFAVFGVSLMLSQFRLHPFGSWVFIVGSFLLFDEWRLKSKVISPLAGAAIMLLALALAFQPPLRIKLFQSYPPGLTKDYAATRILFPSLAAECAKDQGNVLSYSDDGHYIRFHTDCGVLTNNFLISPLHEQKILAADRLMQLSPSEFLSAAPDVKYIFVRMYEIFTEGPEGVLPVPLNEVASRNAPLFVALTFDRDLPAEYELIDEVRVDDERDFAYARVFKINRGQ